MASSSAASIIFFTIFAGIISLSQSSLVDHACGTNGNYTTNSLYDRNLGTALAKLYSNANTSNSGFYNASVGKDSDKVNALVLCRGDVQPGICRSCVRDAVDKIRKLCPNQKEAVEWYDECMLRYSNDSVINNPVNEPTREMFNAKNATDAVQFSKDRKALLDEVREEAIVQKFATRNMSTGTDGKSTIYGLMQCTPDLDIDGCHDCLDDALEEIADGSGTIGGQVLKPSCRLRFEITPFYNETTIVFAPSPQPQPSPPPPSSSSHGNYSFTP